MNIEDYSRCDATELAALVARGEVSAKELAQTAAAAIARANPDVNSVVETYDDRIEGLDEATLGAGPFRGVPFLIKDVLGHEKDRRIEFGSRLAAGVKADADTHLAELLRASGVNIIGRSNAPEYSMSGTTENALYGNTSSPWKKGYSAGGSTGGGMAAVVSGMVPLAQGGDIAGSIRIPASWSGGVGFKPSRGRITAGPMADEGGFGLLTNFVQSKSIRDTAAMLDCLAVPQVGDPFPIPHPGKAYAEVFREAPPRLKVGFSLSPLMGVAVDPEVGDAVKSVARTLADMGHEVAEAGPEYDGLDAARRFLDVWFFGFDLRAEMLAAKSGRTIGPDTLEPTTLKIYEHAKRITPAGFLAAMGAINAARRQLSRFFADYDIWLSPTTAKVAEPHGTFNLGRADASIDEIPAKQLAVPCQFALPHNVMGTPAVSLPLAMHASGLPVGIQIGARPAQEHVVLQLAAALEDAMPWAGRVPPLHASRS